MNTGQLLPGNWTISVTVDDDPLCPDAAAANTASTTISIVEPPPALVSLWRLDGDLDDSQGSANGGTFAGDIAPSFSPGADGTDPGAVVLDGLDDQIQVLQNSGLPIYANRACSVAMWVKGPSSQADRRIFSEANLLGQTGLLRGGLVQGQDPFVAAPTKESAVEAAQKSSIAPRIRPGARLDSEPHYRSPANISRTPLRVGASLAAARELQSTTPP